ncbi:hypothetical protein [Devosia sp.]|uniref:hypothetical protein n=1 Tax=Devosia sp. TaxID=1871048 RepID=UPI003A95B54F
MSPFRRMTTVTLAGGLLLLLGGCIYDYTQRTDRVSYNAGDAVKANLEAQTTDPSKDSMYRTDGLGKNGAVVGQGEDDAPPTTTTPVP